MIPDEVFSAYAQYNEDIILAALLYDTKNGFYVDVGANHEKYHSVTKYFYERGWHGINIEPIPRLIKEIAEKRPRDKNLNYAVASKKSVMEFREYPKHDGLSTFSEQSKKENEKLGLPHKDYDIKVDSLANIFSEQKVGAIDFLKIDVEGFEKEVVHSNDWKKYRPKVICIEANHREEDWSIFLERQGYQKVIFDGLNEYYIAKEHKEIFNKFAERAAVLAHNAIRSHHLELWKGDLNHMDELREMAKRQEKAIVSLRQDYNLLKDQTRSIRYLSGRLKELALRRAGLHRNRLKK